MLKLQDAAIKIGSTADKLGQLGLEADAGHL